MNPDNQNNNLPPQPGAQPMQPMQPSQPAQPAPVAPAQSAMPNMQSAQPQPQPAPVTNNQPFFGFGTANPGVEPAPVPTPVTTSTTNVLSPTHFDDLRFQQQAATNQQKPAKAPESPEKTIKKFMTLSISLGIAAVVFLIAGIISVVLLVNTNDDLDSVTKEKNSLNNIITAIEEQTETEISTVEDIPTYQPAENFVYLTDWGIKLEIPDTLTSVSYILDQNADYRPKVCFNAIKEGVQYFPAFADIKQNPGGMGCLQRISIEDGEKDSNGNSFGTNVFTNGDFNYFYQAPSKVYSGSDAEKGLESTAVQLIKTMISDNISTYK